MKGAVFYYKLDPPDQRWLVMWASGSTVVQRAFRTKAMAVGFVARLANVTRPQHDTVYFAPEPVIPDILGSRTIEALLDAADAALARVLRKRESR